MTQPPVEGPPTPSPWGPPPGWDPQPGWSPPPGWPPSPPERPRRRGARIALWTCVGVGAAALLALAATAGLLLGRAAADDMSADGGPQADPARTQALLDDLPTAFQDCQGTDLSGTGDTAAAECGPVAAAPAPTDALFYRYPDQQSLDRTFLDDVGTDEDDGGFFAHGLDGSSAPLDCATASGAGTWSGGRIACGTTEDDEVLLVWTDEEHQVEGFLFTDGDGPADIAGLYAWWQRNGAYQG